MSAVEINYTAWKGAPWGGSTNDVQIIILGEDWSAHTFSWKFATAEGGSAVITLANAGAGSEGISKTYDADYEHPTSGAVVGATIIVPQIDEATLEALTFSGAAPLELFHQLYVTPSGGAQFVERFGTLTVRQGISD